MSSKSILWILLVFFVTNQSFSLADLADSNIVSVDANWDDVLISSRTTATLQVVVNPLLRRGSPMHSAAFGALDMLKTNYIRYVPWLPYPRLAVAELFAPSKQAQNWTIPENLVTWIQCPPGQTFSRVVYAIFGPRKVDQCSVIVTSQLESICVPNWGCYLNTTMRSLMKSPCAKSNETFYLSAQLKCAPHAEETSWNFGLLDELLEDFFMAAGTKNPIINYSTTPEWMWNQVSASSVPDDPNQVSWSYETGTTLRDPTMKEISEYYSRLVSWYVNGNFTDEYGKLRISKRTYEFPYWEIMNEPNAEHTMTTQFYTTIYDAVARAIRRVAPRMRFVALATSTLLPDWIEYFLNKSNHVADYIEPSFISYHFYAGGQGNSTKDFESFFPQADVFVQRVREAEIIKKKLAPSVGTNIDEIGVILNGDPDSGEIDPRYWAAAAGMYAYIASKLTVEGIDVVTESQLVGYPSQFPSVSMMDWKTMKPNARYWVLRMLTEEFHLGDKLVRTNSSRCASKTQTNIEKK